LQTDPPAVRACVLSCPSGVAVPTVASQSGTVVSQDDQVMKRKAFLRWGGAVVGVAALGPVLTACGGGDEPSLVASGRLSPEEIDGLFFLREEEKLAHDVYTALYAQWGAAVFGNIIPSEAQHTEAIRQRIFAHGLIDPAANTGDGVFVNAELQALYNDLVSMGRPSLVAALKVGCLIEEKDIWDIEQKKLQVQEEADLVSVYDQLLCGSRNHLRAFSRALESAGSTYDQPQYLSLDQWAAIARSPQERCGG
jgi:hypothetical protein